MAADNVVPPGRVFSSRSSVLLRSAVSGLFTLVPLIALVESGNGSRYMYLLLILSYLLFFKIESRSMLRVERDSISVKNPYSSRDYSGSEILLVKSSFQWLLGLGAGPATLAECIAVVPKEGRTVRVASSAALNERQLGELLSEVRAFRERHGIPGDEAYLSWENAYLRKDDRATVDASSR